MRGFICGLIQRKKKNIIQHHYIYKTMPIDDLENKKRIKDSLKEYKKNENDKKIILIYNLYKL